MSHADDKIGHGFGWETGDIETDLRDIDGPNHAGGIELRLGINRLPVQALVIDIDGASSGSAI